MHSPEWQNLPEWLLEPLMAQALSMDEAMGLHLAILDSADQEVTPLAPSLFPAAEKLFLWEVEASPTLH